MSVYVDSGVYVVTIARIYICVETNVTGWYMYSTFFVNDTATTEIYTRSRVGSVRCV